MCLVLCSILMEFLFGPVSDPVFNFGKVSFWRLTVFYQTRLILEDILQTKKKRKKSIKIYKKKKTNIINRTLWHSPSLPYPDCASLRRCSCHRAVDEQPSHRRAEESYVPLWSQREAPSPIYICFQVWNFVTMRMWVLSCLYVPSSMNQDGKFSLWYLNFSHYKLNVPASLLSATTLPSFPLERYIINFTKKWK